MICASIYLEKLASNLPAPPSTRTGLMRCLPVTFLLRLRHALGNSSRRIGALSYNSYADKVTGTRIHWLCCRKFLTGIGDESLIATRIRQLASFYFWASSNCSQQSFCSAFDTRLAVLLERTGALSYNSYADKVTGSYTLAVLLYFTQKLECEV